MGDHEGNAQHRVAYWLDTETEITPMRVQGLDSGLFDGLSNADALLVLTPAPGGRKLSGLQTIWEVFDRVAASLSASAHVTTSYTAYYFFVVLNYRHLYGIELLQNTGESWQQWEARVGDKLGLEVIPVTILDPAVTTISNDTAIVIHAASIEEDFARHLLPRLQTVGPRKHLEMTPRGKEICSLMKSSIKAFVLGLLLTVVMAFASAIAVFILLIYLFGLKIATCIAIPGLGICYLAIRRML